MTNSERALRWVRPPQQQRSQATLDRILDAAEVLVAEKGFDDTPISEIVRRAGSSVGAFYSRFRDKEGLLHELYERYLAQAIATADDALAPERWRDARVGEILEEVVRFLVAIYREQRGLMRVFVHRNHTDPAFQARRERLSNHVTHGLAELLLARSGEIHHPDPARAAAFGMAFVFSTLDNTILFGEFRSGTLALADDEIATELTRAYLAYLGVPNQTQSSKG